MPPRPGSDDAAGADMHSGEDSRLGADETVVTDGDSTKSDDVFVAWLSTETPGRPVMGDERAIERQGRMVPYRYQPRFTAPIRTSGDPASFSDPHADFSRVTNRIGLLLQQSQKLLTEAGSFPHVDQSLRNRSRV